MKYTLKLDASFRPLEIIDSFKATNMILSGRARVLEEYREEIYPNINYPCVIVLCNYVRTRPFYKRCNRKNVVWRDNNTCQYCGNRFPYKELTMDHVLPKSKGGTKTWSNIVASCKNCNNRKGDATLSKTSLCLINQPQVPKVTFEDLEHPCKIKNQWRKYLWMKT